MTLHREGRTIIATTVIILGGLYMANLFLFRQLEVDWLYWGVNVLLLALLVLILQFFRIPKRQLIFNEGDVICPADGKVVVIEEVEETEYFKDKRIQVSVFMSPLNVHANYYPISGENTYVKYHPGKFLVAWHPKSSTENERSTVVTKDKNGTEVLFRQIAGALARRICLYAEEQGKAEAGKEFGFIKFGSRIDIFLPLDCQINVKIGDKVKGIETKIASLYK
jgi:phosphatidylserine decarboxylase